MSDQYRYTRERVEALIDCVWDGQFSILAAKAEQERSSKADPSHGNNIVAMVADVRKAWRGALEKMDGEMLLLRHVHLLTFEAIAELAGLESAHEAAEIEECAMTALLNKLNGTE